MTVPFPLPPRLPLPQIALQCLDKVAACPAPAPPSPGAPSSSSAAAAAAPQRLTYSCDGHNVCFLLDAAGFSE